jgi:hypothetical protein
MISLYYKTPQREHTTTIEVGRNYRCFSRPHEMVESRVEVVKAMEEANFCGSVICKKSLKLQLHLATSLSGDLSMW